MTTKLAKIYWSEVSHFVAYVEVNEDEEFDAKALLQKARNLNRDSYYRGIEKDSVTAWIYPLNPSEKFVRLKLDSFPEFIQLS